LATAEAVHLSLSKHSNVSPGPKKRWEQHKGFDEHFHVDKRRKKRYGQHQKSKHLNVGQKQKICRQQNRKFICHECMSPPSLERGRIGGGGGDYE
jgi:hypothetical protein